MHLCTCVPEGDTHHTGQQAGSKSTPHKTALEDQPVPAGTLARRQWCEIGPTVDAKKADMKQWNKGIQPVLSNLDPGNLTTVRCECHQVRALAQGLSQAWGPKGHHHHHPKSSPPKMERKKLERTPYKPRPKALSQYQRYRSTNTHARQNMHQYAALHKHTATNRTQLCWLVSACVQSGQHIGWHGHAASTDTPANTTQSKLCLCCMCKLTAHGMAANRACHGS